MNKFGNKGLQRLKSRVKGPGKYGIGATESQAADDKNKIAEIVARNQKKYGYKPVDSKPQMLDADRLNDPNYGKDGFFTKLKTVVSNPFDSLISVMGTNPNMTSLRQVRQLHEARDKGSEDAAGVLARSSALNTASSFIPAAATADAVMSAVQGDPTAAITKKLNKIKPVAKGLKNLKLDPKKATKVISTGVKAAKTL